MTAYAAAAAAEVSTAEAWGFWILGSLAVIGGLGMGWGAAWAGGCTIGNAMVNTATFSFQGWTALVFMVLGTGLAAKLFILNHRGKGTTPVPASGSGSFSGMAVTAWSRQADGSYAGKLLTLPDRGPNGVGSVTGTTPYDNRVHSFDVTFRPLADTVRATLAYYHAQPAERQATLRAGLTPEKERETLAAWHAKVGR